MGADGFTVSDSGARTPSKAGALRDRAPGKGRYDLLPPEAVRRMAVLYERGAAKYAARNWERGMPVSWFIDSALRHAFQYLEGERTEDHLAQAAFNLFGAMTMEERMPEQNDMPWAAAGISAGVPEKPVVLEVSRLSSTAQPVVVVRLQFIVYGSPQCPVCQQTVTTLKSLGHKVEERDSSYWIQGLDEKGMLRSMESIRSDGTSDRRAALSDKCNDTLPLVELDGEYMNAEEALRRARDARPDS